MGKKGLHCDSRSVQRRGAGPIFLCDFVWIMYAVSSALGLRYASSLCLRTYVDRLRIRIRRSRIEISTSTYSK